MNRRFYFLMLPLLVFCQHLRSQDLAKTFAVTSDRPIIIPVIDLDKSEAYYSKVFGAEVVKIPDELHQVRRFLKMANGMDIILKIGRVRYNDPDALEMPQIWVTVPANVFEKYETFLSSAKIPRKEIAGKTANPNEPRRIFINDLDGYVICLSPR